MIEALGPHEITLRSPGTDHTIWLECTCGWKLQLDDDESTPTAAGAAELEHLRQGADRRSVCGETWTGPEHKIWTSGGDQDVTVTCELPVPHPGLRHGVTYRDPRSGLGIMFAWAPPRQDRADPDGA